jgi:penicillin-binding protein 1B
VSSAGETLWQADDFAEPRLSSQGNYLINYAMIKVAEQGTAKSLSWRFPDMHLAGKTGTSNDLRDSWFVGYDAKHLVTTWVGRDDNKSSGLTGSSGALTVFSHFMNNVGVVSLPLQSPEGIDLAYFDPKTGQAFSEDCEGSVFYPAIIDGLHSYSSCQHQEAEAPKKTKKKSWFERLFGD